MKQKRVDSGKLYKERIVRREKQKVALILERGTLLHCMDQLAPFAVSPIQYEGRKVFEMKFKAFDCYYLPGGTVAVNIGRYYGLAILECSDVLEIHVGDQVTKNRLLCPTCHYASLKSNRQEEISNTRRYRNFATCQRKQCGAEATFES